MNKLAVKAVVVIVLLGTMAIGLGPTVDPVESIHGFLYISHRGGMKHFPEESMEAFRASAAGGFLVEMDVRSLSNGTLVCNHDPITDWRPGLATFEEVLAELGDANILVPELKDPGAVESFLGMLKSHGLRGSTIVQSWDWGVASRAAAEGFHVCFLLGSSTSLNFDDVTNQGIEYVGVSTETTRAFVSDLIDHGLKVLIYTVNARSEASAYALWGISGVFTDDPWSVAH